MKNNIFNNQRGEVATFISIATLIGIAVLTFVTANINTNVAQKRTIETKAEDMICSCGEETNYDYCETYEQEDYICDYNTETQCTDPDDSETCNYVQVPVYCTRDTDVCLSYGKKCSQCTQVVDPYDPQYQSADNNPQSTCTGSCTSGSCYWNDMDYADGDCGDGVSYCCKAKETIALPEFYQDPDEGNVSNISAPNTDGDRGCSDASLICDPTRFTCEDGSYPVGDCRVSGYDGICCGSSVAESTVEPDPEPELQSAAPADCESLGGSCEYDVWPASVDENVYEKLSGGSCEWTEAVRSCYRARTTPATEEEKAENDKKKEESGNQGVVLINGVETRSYSFAEGIITIEYVPETYTAEEPAVISETSAGENVVLTDSDGVVYRVDFTEPYEVVSSDENLEKEIEQTSFVFN